LADGSAINLMAAQQARDLRDAFDQLTRAAATEAISEVA
jgi:hypothetical protein